MNVESERERGGTKTRIPNNQIESGGRATNKHVENPRRRGGGHERGTDMLLREIGRDGMRGMTVASVNSGNIVKTGNGSRIGNNRNGSDRSVISVNISGGNLQFDFFKKNGRILTNGLKKGSPSTKIVMENSGHILVITKSEGTDMSGLGDKAGKGENGRSRRGNGGSDGLRTLGRGTNRDGHDEAKNDLRLGKEGVSGSRFRVKFKRQ